MTTYEEAKTALAAVFLEADEARKAEANLRAVLRHATVEIALRQEDRVGDEIRREELFGMLDANKLRLAIGDGRCIVEIYSELAPDKSDA